MAFRMWARVGLVVLGLGACSSPTDGGGGGGGVEAVTITAPAGAVVRERVSVALTATLRVNGTERVATPTEVRWSLPSPSDGSITADGVFTPGRPGEITVRAEATANPQRSGTLVVRADSAELVSVRVLPITGVVPGDTIRPQVLGLDAAGRDRRPAATLVMAGAAFEAAGPGAFRAIAVGSGTVTATVGALSATQTIAVAIGSPARLLVADSARVEIEQAGRLGVPAVDRRGNVTPTAAPLGATSRTPTVVTARIEADSVVLEGVGLGRAWVVVSRGGLLDSVRVRVTPPPLVALHVTAVDPELDWTGYARVRVEVEATNGRTYPYAELVRVRQVGGEAGLLTTSVASPSEIRVRTGLPPVRGDGSRRDAGVVGQLAFDAETLTRGLSLPLRYRRPVAMRLDVARGGQVEVGGQRPVGRVLLDSTGSAIAFDRVVGTLAPVTSAAPTIASITTNTSVLGVAEGTTELRTSYREGSTELTATAVVTVALPPSGPEPMDATPFGDGYIRIVPMEPIPASGRAALEEALARIEPLIAGTPRGTPVTLVRGPNHCTSGTPAINGQFDGLTIYVSFRLLSETTNPLASAGPCIIRSGALKLPVMGVVLVNTSAAATDYFRRNGALTNTVTHELLHALGIGTLWGGFAGSTPLVTPPDRYTAPFGLEALRLLGVATDAVLETTGGSGTAGSHWRETTFGREIMTGFGGEGYEPISILTAASLRDLGYVVNMARADAYTLGTGLQGLQAGPPGARVPYGDDIIRPTYVVDERTGRLWAIRGLRP